MEIEDTSLETEMLLWRWGTSLEFEIRFRRRGEFRG